jgi:uncharacterized membrane-anchored protein YhcB (DUF1043 family)
MINVTVAFIIGAIIGALAMYFGLKGGYKDLGGK